MQDAELSCDMSLESGLAAFTAKHFSRAMQHLSPLADRGDAEAQYRCAIMFQGGLGVARNCEAAHRWMQAAAEQGHALAQHGLGFMYLEGECAERRPELAVAWFEKAAAQGLAGSLTTLAMMYEEGRGVPRDAARAHELVQRALRGDAA